ncbi:hypothetical protein H0H81_011170 [Sphagnurus paluster]|uniref:Uncharacterized protein n=1 Tax=Sphagnurus paluster TaxID=117069 RepID=A0A9P7FV91_9AGAR|nr:hypothetical protein H0H81_011170 [Sphagnurus paluster]
MPSRRSVPTPVSLLYHLRKSEMILFKYDGNAPDPRTSYRDPRALQFPGLEPRDSSGQRYAAQLLEEDRHSAPTDGDMSFDGLN